jgi:type II secretory pathway component PulC
MQRWLVVVSLLVVVNTAFADDDEPLLACKAATGKIHAVFKPETELKDLATWLMGFTCKNVIVGAGVDMATKITILAPNAMTSKQAVKLFSDSVDAAGYVVLDRGDDIVIKPGPSSPKPCSDASATADDVPVEVKQIDDKHYEITTKSVDAVRANPNGAAKGARVILALRDGKPWGLKLYAVRPNSIYAKLGLRNGDTIQRINGLELTSLDKASDAYNKLSSAKSVELDIMRRGTPIVLLITVKN